MPLSKADQEAARAAEIAAGTDPGMNAQALDVVDDLSPGDGAPPRTLGPTGEPAPQRPLPPAKSAFDTKRADIINRFRTSRTEEADKDRDDISDFTRSGLPPEFAPEPAPAPAAELAGETGEEPPLEAPPVTQKYKVKVRGEEIEMSQEDLIAHAQKSLAGESYLEEGKSKLKEIDALYREVKNNGQRAGQEGEHHAPPQRTQATEPQPQAAADPADPNTTDDTQIERLLEQLQFGADPAEAKTLLRNTIATEAVKVARPMVQEELLNDRLRDEGARTQKVLADFLGKHKEIAEDPKARAVVEYDMYEQQLADLHAIGIDPNTFELPHGGPPTPGDIAQAHRYYRAKGYGMKTPQTMLEKAVENLQSWRGVKTPEPAADPGKAPPRVDVTVERSARRQAAPQQPTRTVAPNPGGDPPAAPQPRDRSSIVQSMAQRRNAPRGRIVA